MDEKKEKRRYDRVGIALEGTFNAEGLLFTSFIQNISLGGMCIECNKPIKPGTKVNTVISGNPPIKIKGMVVWCKKHRLNYQIGIRFHITDKQQKEVLKEIITSFFWLDQPDI